MKLAELRGSSKQIEWARRIRDQKISAWQNSSQEKYEEIEAFLAQVTDAGWWIAYRDQAVSAVYNHLVEGVDLQQLRKDEWVKKQRGQERKDAAEVRSLLRKEFAQERNAQHEGGARLIQPGAGVERRLRWESQAFDMQTGEVSSDPDLPF